MRYLDTNIILRYLVQPATSADAAKHRACAALFERLRTGAEHVQTREVVIAEVIYVLTARAHYGLTHAEAAERLRPILAVRGLHLSGKRTYRRALDLFSSFPDLDIEDAIQIAHMEREGVNEILSYDTDFDRVPGIERIEP